MTRTEERKPEEEGRDKWEAGHELLTSGSSGKGVKNKRIWGLHRCQDELFSQVNSTTGRGGEGKGLLTPARLDAADYWGCDSQF